jgi:cell pole-organizing protein PopZ
MSDTDADQQEPSMEEILASIRRIISEDGEEGEEEAVETEEEAVDEPEPVEAVAEEEPVEDEDDGVLVLTDMVSRKTIMSWFSKR